MNPSEPCSRPTSVSDGGATPGCASPKIRVMVVDDDFACRQVLRATLGALDFDVRSAENGFEALALYRLFAPSLILLDLYMPLKDGIETLMALNREGNTAPVVLMSDGGSMGYSCVQNLTILGASGALRKPFSTEDLIGTINTVLGSSHKNISLPAASVASAAGLV